MESILSPTPTSYLLPNLPHFLVLDFSFFINHIFLTLETINPSMDRGCALAAIVGNLFGISDPPHFGGWYK